MASRPGEPPIPWREAQRRVLEAVRALPAEEVPLAQAEGRALAQAVHAPVPMPPLANSAMDGFAARSGDLAAGIATLPLIAPIRAGDPPGDLPLGHAAPIATGAPLPAGADTVVPAEDASRDGATARLPGGWPAGRFVRDAGSDLAAGALALPAGAVLGPAEAGLLAALGVLRVRVPRRPVVAILSTGSELVPPEADPTPGRIRESNAVAIDWACRRLGARTRLLGIAADEPRVLAERLAEGLSADLLVTSGGVSVGERDLVRATLAELGAEERFWGIALRPGKPCTLAVRGTVAILGLPGNPASALVGAALMMAPAIRTLSGGRPALLPWERARAEGTWPEPVARDQAVRCRIRHDGGEIPLAVPTGDQGSHRIASLVGADALALAPAGTAVRPGDSVHVLRDPWSRSGALAWDASTGAGSA